MQIEVHLFSRDILIHRIVMPERRKMQKYTIFCRHAVCLYSATPGLDPAFRERAARLDALSPSTSLTRALAAAQEPQKRSV